MNQSLGFECGLEGTRVTLSIMYLGTLGSGDQGESYIKGDILPIMNPH